MDTSRLLNSSQAYNSEVLFYQSDSVSVLKKCVPTKEVLKRDGHSRKGQSEKTVLFKFQIC